MKEFIKTVLRQAVGDDYERAKLSFGEMPDELLDSEYGQSGMTRREILEGYKARNQKFTDAIEWLDAHCPIEEGEAA